MGQVDHTDMPQRIKQCILEVDPEAEVWLYGSRARRDARPDSDWDVLVLSPREQMTLRDEEQLLDHLCPLMFETAQAIQLFAYSKHDWHTRHAATPFYQSVQAEAIRL